MKKNKMIENSHVGDDYNPNLKIRFTNIAAWKEYFIRMCCNCKALGWKPNIRPFARALFEDFHMFDTMEDAIKFTEKRCQAMCA